MVLSWSSYNPVNPDSDDWRLHFTETYAIQYFKEENKKNA
jgi:hypothetical protein